MTDPNDDEMTLDDFLRWKVGALKAYLADRGLKRTGRKDELAALAYAAAHMKKPVLPTAVEEKRRHADQYKQLLKCGDNFLPDPYELKDGWVGESKGLSLWPPTSIVELSNHLARYDGNQPSSSASTSSSSRLKSRLLSDYKEGKAYSYFDARWLKEVFFHPISDDSTVCFLKAECTPSERVRQTPHKPWVCVDKTTGTIHSAFCTCHAGLGSTCNHVAAILFKLDYSYQRGWTSKACTSRPCTWNQYHGGATVNDMLEGKRICDMDWRKPSYKKGDSRETINPPSRKLFQPTKASPPSISALTNALFATVSRSSVAQYLKVEPPIQYAAEEDFNVVDTIEVETSAQMQVPSSLHNLAASCNSVEEFLSKLTPYNEDDVQLLQESTVGQDKNPMWQDQRKGRVTGSNVHGILTRRRTTSKQSDEGSVDVSRLVKRVMGFDKPNENLRALAHGRFHESKARDMYIQTMSELGHENVTVKECGLFVCRSKPYIGSSPDGIVTCTCCGTGLLEIKCPISVYGHEPTADNLKYLHENDDGKTQLKKSHTYYTQVQMQMGTTSSEWCDFFVYTGVDSLPHLERIEFDHELWLEIMEAASWFFKGYLAPELVGSL